MLAPSSTSISPGHGIAAYPVVTPGAKAAAMSEVRELPRASVPVWLRDIIVAAVSAGIVIGAGVVGFLWKQTIQLAEMNKVLAIVCEQIEQKGKKDDRQDERLNKIESELKSLIDRTNYDRSY